MSVEISTRVADRQTPASTVALNRELAIRGTDLLTQYLDDPLNRPVIECAMRIRAVETALYTLFGQGKLHGTIHTCLGQEFTGAILADYLRDGDFVTSNHRCHGHFIAATGDWRGLVDEIVGNENGVCAGIGSSQHLWAPNFMSNGQQGGLLPVGAGIALDRKLCGRSNLVTSFIGEGTLGEGVVYETLNLDGLWTLPHIVVCENNFYSQSTPQSCALSGEITSRADSFGVASLSGDTWNLAGLDAAVATCVERARRTSAPSFLNIATYRLNPHSKGDDQRDKTEIEWFRNRDPLTTAIREHRAFRDLYDTYAAEVIDYAERALAKPGLAASSYFGDQLPRTRQDAMPIWTPVSVPPADCPRLAQQLNAYYRDWLERDPGACFIGEDIADPYGGAFKVAKGLTTAFPSRALTTPISEAAITGLGLGLAVSGRRAFVEIMFADFITYAFDQIVNNASKFFHIYNRNVECPVIIRTPVGGRRGYGPTHSQSLERFLIGIDNVCTISLSSIGDVPTQLACLASLHCPVLLLENKADYTARPFVPPAAFMTERDDAAVPTFRIRPRQAVAGVTLLAYGGMARLVADSLIDIFGRCDVVPELVVPVSLHPLNLAPITESVRRTGRLVVIEEGGGFGSVGAEVLAQLQEQPTVCFAAARVSGRPVPVPSAPALEAAALPGIDDICRAVTGLMERPA